MSQTELVVVQTAHSRWEENEDFHRYATAKPAQLSSPSSNIPSSISVINVPSMPEPIVPRTTSASALYSDPTTNTHGRFFTNPKTHHLLESTPITSPTITRTTTANTNPNTSHNGVFSPFQSRAALLREEKSRVAEKRLYRVVLAALFFTFFLLGLNDGSIGPLLPVYQDYYHINFLKVSMVFISNCLGCLTSAVLNVFLSSRMTFSKILTLATIFQMTAYAMMTSAPKPFALMCVGFFLNGMGMSLLNAQGNAILSMLHNPTAMGFAHASYGTGALVAPLISTQFAEMHTYVNGNPTSAGGGHPKTGDSSSGGGGGHPWSYYYAILVGTAVLNALVTVGVFRGKGYEEVLRLMAIKNHNTVGGGAGEGEGEERDGLALSRIRARSQEEPEQQESGAPITLVSTRTSRADVKAKGQTVREREEQEEATPTRMADVDAVESATGNATVVARRKEKEGASFVAVLKQLHVHILAAFVFIYVGTEVTIGGWIVTFMINERGGGVSSGYVSSGFFGGLALGRVVLLRVNRLLGERNAVFLYIGLGIALEITIWFVPSLIGNAIAVSLVGMALGPFYPIVMNQTGRLIPRKVLSGSIGWIAGFGQSGSAVLPFLTGALANKYGIIALQPL
ncbi:hypothetical protein FRC17_001074 [Serendipita sp. 399]|nr:hypothetical protein FRC17_001074 [Serendipita sp. 399]